MRRRTPIIPDSSKRKFSQQVENLSQSERAVLSIVGELPFSEETDQPPERYREDIVTNDTILDAQSPDPTGRSDAQTPTSTGRLAEPDVLTPRSSERSKSLDVQSSNITGRPVPLDAQTSNSHRRLDPPDSQTDDFVETAGDINNRTLGRPDAQASRRPDIPSLAQRDRIPFTPDYSHAEESSLQRKPTKKPALSETGQKITLYLEPDIVMKAKIRATMEKSTMSELIGRVLKEHFSSE